jgi:hypothetical protein
MVNASIVGVIAEERQQRGNLFLTLDSGDCFVPRKDAGIFVIAMTIRPTHA